MIGIAVLSGALLAIGALLFLGGFALGASKDASDVGADVGERPGRRP